MFIDRWVQGNNNSITDTLILQYYTLVRRRCRSTNSHMIASQHVVADFKYIQTKYS